MSGLSTIDLRSVTTVHAITIFGTGALGMLFAGRFAGAGAAESDKAREHSSLVVTIAGHWPEAIAAIRQQGVIMDVGGSQVRAPVPAVDLAAGDALAAADVVLVLVKSYQTADVAVDVARAVRNGGLVLTLQNGLGNAERLARAVGARATVVQGTTTCSATLIGPGRVRPGGVGTTVLEAPADAGALALVRQLAVLMQRSGLGSVSLERDIRAHVWRKLLAACSLLPLAAIYRLPNGALVDHPEARPRLAAAANETAAVARALGVAVPADPVGAVLAIAAATAANRASMLQDVERGRPTEIEATVGEVVRLARAVDLRVPELERLWAEVTHEEGRRGSTDDN